MRRHQGSRERAAHGSSAAPLDGRRAAGMALRALTATAVTVGGAALLARTAAQLAAAAPAVGPGVLQGWVACGAVAVGAAALLVIAMGCLLTTVGAAGRVVGCTLNIVERAGARLTPGVVRRALVLGLGAALAAGVAAPASAHESAARSIAVQAQRALAQGDDVTGEVSADGDTAAAPADGATSGAASDGDTAVPAPASRPPLELGWAAAVPATAKAEPAKTLPGTSASPTPTASGAGEPVAPASSPVVPTAPAPTAPAPAAPAPATAAPSPVPSAAPAPAPAAPVTVVVRAGDSLWSITAGLMPTADDAALAAAWPRLYAANLGVVGADPDLIRPGQVLTVPVEELS